MLGSSITKALAAFAIVATTAGLTSTAATAATRAPATPPAYNTGQINIRGACLSDTNDSTTPGNPVRVEKCAAHSAQEWTLDTDGTIRVNGHAGKGCLGLSSAGTAQIVGCGDLSAQWFPQADKELVNVNQSTPQAKSCLYAPSASAGSSLVRHGCGSTFAGLEFTIPNTRYAASALTYRPDSGGSGTSWALDNMTRDASVTYLGTAGTGHYSYEGSVVDNGTFVTIAGNDTPNQGMDPGQTLGDSLTGAMTGQWGFTFTASNLASTMPPAAVQGVADPTGSWNELFFTKSTTFGGTGGVSTGPEQWSWSYRTAADNCGHAEVWSDANNNNGGQETAANGGTDITAPAPGATCPA
jgi:hypothetical protein